VALSIAATRLSHMNSTVCATDAVSSWLDELQVGLAEGPIADASRHGRPVLVPDLFDMPQPRWLWFTPAALHTGALAMFVFPLGAGRVRLGALSLYRSTNGALSPQQFHSARFLAEAAQSVLISTLWEDPHAEACAWAVADGTGFQARVYQAVGVTTAQLHINADDALARMRAHAYTVDRPMREVASDIVRGDLRLEAA
jgi:hypothetical protein